MISCWWSADVYSDLVGRWTDNDTGKILKSCYFNKYFWGTITTVFWSFDKNYIWLLSNSGFGSLFLTSQLCWYEMLDQKTACCMGNSRSQSNDNDISLFPKKWCFFKKISNFVSGEVGTSRILKFKNFGGLWCKKLYKYLIVHVVQNCG